MQLNTNETCKTKEEVFSTYPRNQGFFFFVPAFKAQAERRNPTGTLYVSLLCNYLRNFELFDYIYPNIYETSKITKS